MYVGVQVLVSLDTRLLFLEEMNLEMDDRVHIQPLVYEGIPLHCLRCHALDNIVDLCPHPLRVKGLNQPVWKDTCTFNWPINQSKRDVNGDPSTHVSPGHLLDGVTSLGTGVEIRGLTTMEMEVVGDPTTSSIHASSNRMGMHLSSISFP